MNLTIFPGSPEPASTADFGMPATKGVPGLSAPPPDAFARLVDETATEPKQRPANEDADEVTTLEAAGQGWFFPRVPLPPGQVPVSLAEIPAGNRTITLPAAVSVKGNKLVGPTEFFTEVEAPVTEAPLAKFEATGAPAAPAAPKTTAADAVAKELATPTAAGEKARLEPPGAQASQDVGSLVPPAPTSGMRRIEAGLAAPTQNDSRRGRVAAGQAMQTKPVTDQDGMAPLMEQELPDPAAWSIAERSPERPRGQRFVAGSLPEARSISPTFSGPDLRAAATETVAVSDASPMLADRLLARVPLPPGQVPVSLAEIPAGNRTITLPAAVSVEGNKLVGPTEFFTEVEAPVTEAPLAKFEATGAPAAPAAPKTTAADAVAKELATPTAAGEKARLEPPGARASQDVGSLVPPAPTSGVRRIEAGLAAPTQTDSRRGRVAAGQAMQTKPVTDQDGMAPLMEQELPDPATWSIAERSPERPRGQRFVAGSLPEAGSISPTFSGPDLRAAATETVAVSDASPMLADRLLARVPLPPGQVPVSLAEIPAGNRTITLPAAVSVKGNKLVGPTEFFTEVEVPVTEAPLAKFEATGAPAAPAAPKTTAADAVAKELATPTAAGEKARLEPPGARASQDVGSLVPPAPTSGMRRIEAGLAAPTQNDSRRGRVAAGQAMQTKPLTDQDGMAPLMEQELPAAVSVEGNKLVGPTEFFTEVEAPVTEAPLAKFEATGAPAAPAAPKTTAADAVAKELATPTTAGEKARLEPPGAQASQDVGSLVPPVPTSGVRRIEAGLAAPTQNDSRRGRVAAGQAMQTKPVTDQDGMAPLMEQELPAAVSVEGNKLVGSTEFFTEVEAPVTEAPLAKFEATGAPAAPAAPKTTAADAVAKELATPTAAGEKARLEPPGAQASQDVGSLVPPAPTSSMRRIEAGLAAPTQNDSRRGMVAAVQPMQMKPVTNQDGMAPLMEQELPAAVSVEGNKLVGPTEFFTEVEAPVTEAPLAKGEATGAPAAPAAPKTTAADAVAKELATPTAAGEKARLEPPGAQASQDVGSLVPPAPTSSMRRIEAGLAAPTQNDSRRGMVAAVQPMQMKPVTNQDEIAPLVEQELPDPAAGSIAERSPERPRGQRFVEGSLPEAGSISPTFSGPDHRAAATETVPVSDASPTLANRLLPLVSTEARLFKQAGPGELSVLLKPDLRTEIVLHLRTSAGRVEATVRCERGDFQTLNAEWGQLRESLAPQGVHLLPLVEPPSISLPRAGGPASHPSLTSGDQPPPRERAPEPLDELPLTGSVTGSPRPARQSGGSARRLLESWA